MANKAELADGLATLREGLAQAESAQEALGAFRRAERIYRRSCEALGRIPRYTVSAQSTSSAIVVSK